MATLYGLGRNFYAYLSDDGNTYQVAITNDDATAGGFATAVVPGLYPPLPRGWRMRILYGVNGSVGRTKIPVASASLSQWTTPASFTKHSQTFEPEGARGEHRFTRS